MISGLGTAGDQNETVDYLFNQNLSTNLTHFEATDPTPVFPAYIRTVSMVLCTVILGIGVVGNVMVPLVIIKTKDMRNSTNIFLMNLSIADLMVLLICTPTVLVEVNSQPETWVLGEHMCKAVPFVELTVAHASVLTILAISFERYYAICEPLRAGYVCTKTRAMLICLLAWAFAALFTSPIIVMTHYSRKTEYFDGSMVPTCLTEATTFWPELFFFMIISLFFILPLGVLIVLYTVIARHLMADSGTSNSSDGFNQRARKQVVLMLGTVVLSFFTCLFPFKVFTLWVIIVPREYNMRLGVERYYNILYFCRIMHYLNSAINPILYNLMSSKFRHGFKRLIGIRRKRHILILRNRTTMSTSLNSSTRFRGSPDFSWRDSSLDSRHTNGSIRRSVILRSSLLRNESNRKSRESIPTHTDSYV
ncbi:growth hormone secretagogue receptor type 1-like isoform X1 [Cimex lectularius]|uniref:G-protein coupled receptors family 1 profile domain-containing protein n=1 Tax=Cimex lectularius TaxID=79782 RepID=A0A8I6TBX8_CIMLE|nr:growth hormone secretagogue receptor type 1-like isoform X1 [Cimex lectularius]XP_024081485.1 growth hormone secretagogue receptor type 1-like isoform X1 [Cimex lectularius]XP_024081486.1 growth hormone secretagogue receptor type 1-like isoform X1 [Cimex lectularius]